MKKILMALTAFSAILTAGGDITPTETVTVAPIQEKSKGLLDGFYIGAGVTADQVYVNGDSAWLDDSDNGETQAGYNLVVGYDCYANGKFGVGIEGRYGEGRWNNHDLDTEQYFVGIKPSYDFGVAKPYAVLGYGVSDLSVADEDGFVYGGGVSHPVSKNIEVFVDYVVNPAVTILGTDVENDVVTLGLNYKF
jgi:hypothetical protein